jgi:predicted membrane protein
LREVTVYRNGTLVSLARFSFALAAGIPVGIVLHCIFWAFQLRSEKKAILAALPQQGSQLPRTFYPDPILEWSAWTLWIGLVAFMASMMAVFAVADGFMSSSMVWFVCGALAVGVVVGFIAVYFARRRALTVRVESNGMAYARGRGDLQWLTVGWNEILQLTEKSRTYRGNTRYWLELQFRDNRKKLKLTQSVEGYAALKALLFSVFKTPS